MSNIDKKNTIDADFTKCTINIQVNTIKMSKRPRASNRKQLKFKRALRKFIRKIIPLIFYMLISLI
jgi:hypothetical protein